MITFVTDTLGRIIFCRLRPDLGQIGLCLLERLEDRRRVAFVGRVDFGGDDRPGVEINCVLGLVGQMRGSVLHSGDARILVARGLPLLVGEFLSLSVFVYQITTTL